MSRNQSPSLSDSFLFQEHPVRAQLDGDQLWFIAKDVCEALGIIWKGSGISGSLASIPECWQRVVKFTTHRRGSQSFRCINEPAVYKLAFRSNKPRAEAFTNWIASEVVPEIRKTGKYEVPNPRLIKKSEQLPLRPAAFPAPIDEKPFLEFIEEVQTAHEEVMHIEKGLRMKAIRPAHTINEALSERAGMHLYNKDFTYATGIHGSLCLQVQWMLRNALASYPHMLDDFDNQGYSLLGIVRQLNAR